MVNFKCYCRRNSLILGSVCIIIIAGIIGLSLSLKTDTTQIKNDLQEIRSLLSRSEEDSVFTKLLELERKYYKSINDGCKDYFSKAYSIQSFVFKNYYHDYKLGNHADIMALEIAKDINSSRGLAIDSYNTGNLYLYYEDYSSASYYYNQAFYNFLKTEEYPFGLNLAASKILLTSIYHKRTAETDSVVQTYYKKASKKTSLYNYMCLLDSSSLAVRDGDLDLANEFADRAIKLIDTQQDIKKGTGEVGSIGEFVERAKLAKAHVCIMQNNLRNAINVLRCVERYSDSEKDYYSTSIFKKLEACYESVNMPDSAAYYKNKYKQIDDHFESLRNSSEYREKVKKYNAITEIQNKNQNLYTAKVVAICILSIALLIIFLQILYRYRNILFQGKDDVLTQTVQTEAKYKNSSLSQEEKSTLYNKIIQALGSDPAVFDPEFDVKRLSAIVGTHDRWVSQVINECAGKNFSALLNECRVNEACKRIADKEHYGQFTLGAIGEGVGFKNRTYFTSVFKKITGMTPSEYLDSLQ